jgi:4-amino-4-deoxy-L-arabinose transferase-like glycosyltransferase
VTELRRYAIAAALLVLIATARIISAYPSISHTMDEPIHLGSGMQWLFGGQYTWDPTHPPLARAMAATAVALDGARLQPADGGMREGLLTIGRGAQYDRRLTIARLGVLPLFWVACAAVFLWGWRTGGGMAAVVAIFLFTTIPPVLAHAGVVTTDMAATAFCAAAVVASLYWAEAPTRARSIAFGVVLGLGLLSKLSFLAYVPATWMLMLAWRRPPMREWIARIRPGVIVAVVAVAVLWAGYRFSFTPLRWGLELLLKHNAEGHDSYILGERHRTGVWYFFPVTLLVKTPLALLILLPVALWFRNRRLLAPALYVVAILAVAMNGRINIGVRHVLPIYAGFAVIAGIAAADLLRTRARYVALALLAWQGVSGAMAHPDYISYSNELTRGHPENFVAESDLDWGQDMHRVGEFLRSHGAKEVSFTPYNITYLEYGHPFPKCTFSDWYHPARGWNVVSLSGLKVFNHPGWVKGRAPQYRIGRTHWAWYLP